MQHLMIWSVTFLAAAFLLPHLGASLEVLVTSVCIRNHFIPLIEPISELVSRGHIVTVLLYGNCESWVLPALGEIANNVTVHQSAIDLENLSVDPHDEASDAMYEFGERYEKAFPLTYQTALDFFANNDDKIFDVILCDSYSMGSMMVAEQKRIPLVVNNMLLPPISDSSFYGYNSWSLKSTKDVLQYLFALRAICKPGTDKVMDLRTNLVFQGTYLTPYDYHLGFAILNQGGALLSSSLSSAHQSERYHPTGYQVKPKTISDESKIGTWIGQSPKPIVLVTMGTLTNLDYDEIKSIIDNAKSYSHRFFFHLNVKKIKHFQEQKVHGYTDENVFVTGDADTQALIQNNKIDIVVSQCDAQVILDGISSAKLVVCRPGYLEQFYVANFVEAKNIGVKIYTDLKFENLDGALRRIEKQRNEFQSNVESLKKNLELSGTSSIAADFIETVHKNKLTYKPSKEKIWPVFYEKFYTNMPVLVAVFGGAAFVLINALLLLAFSLCSKSSANGQSKPKAQ